MDRSDRQQLEQVLAEADELCSDYADRIRQLDDQFAKLDSDPYPTEVHFVTERIHHVGLGPLAFLATLAALTFTAIVLSGHYRPGGGITNPPLDNATIVRQQAELDRLTAQLQQATQPPAN